MRAMITCCTALTGCLLKSCESQEDPDISEIHLSWLRSRRHDQNPRSWKPCWLAVQSEHFSLGIRGTRARSCAVQPTVGGVTCVGDGTSLSWNLCWLVDQSRLKGTSFPTPEDVRRCYENDASAVHGHAGRLARQNVALQNELAQSRQQAANELAALRQEVGGVPLRGTQATGVCVDTRLLGKPSDFSGAQDAWRDWSTVFKGYAGAATPRLQMLSGECRGGNRADPNATILDDDDRAASAQLYWMMLMICKGAALNTVFLAGESEGLEAWRQLTEKFESKMRTRLAGQLMSIFSCSLHGDATERITAWEREIATYERTVTKLRFVQCCSDCPNHN